MPSAPRRAPTRTRTIRSSAWSRRSNRSTTLSSSFALQRALPCRLTSPEAERPRTLEREAFAERSIDRSTDNQFMCGIAGKFNFDRTRPVDRERVAAMTTVVSHRGPDADGFYVGDTVGLGHRRLSIIDLSTGDQPLANEDGTLW